MHETNITTEYRIVYKYPDPAYSHKWTLYQNCENIIEAGRIIRSARRDYKEYTFKIQEVLSVECITDYE